jgi:hypothetical protein
VASYGAEVMYQGPNSILHVCMAASRDCFRTTTTERRGRYDDCTRLYAALRRQVLIVDRNGSAYVLGGVGDRLTDEVDHTLQVKGKLIDSTRSR